MLRLVNVFILFLLSSAVQADPVDNLLDKMMQAMKMNNYEGTLVIRQNDKLQAMHVKHGMDDNGIWESLESLSGEARQMIRQNGKVTTIFPIRKLITVSHNQSSFPLHPQLPENRQALKKYYHLKLNGKDRVARKHAQILAVIPKDKFRYGYKYWLDKKTGLLLKCDLLDERGQVIEQLMFSDLNILARSPQSHVLMDQAKEYRIVDIDQGKKNQILTQWKAQRLPAGFILKNAVMETSSSGKGMVQHMTYSDGMSSVSVFVEKQMSEKMALKGVSRMGAVNAFGLPVNQHHVTAIGEAPVATVRMIAESMRYTAQ